MCNLYSITTNQAAIIAPFRVINRYVGNLPPMPGVFPDYPAPVRNAGAERELTMMRWGMPPPPRAGGFPVTNIRNTTSPHWRGWLKPENRCLVPANSFAEYAPEPSRSAPRHHERRDVALMAWLIPWSPWPGLTRCAGRLSNWNVGISKPLDELANVSGLFWSRQHKADTTTKKPHDSACPERRINEQKL